MFVLLWCAQRGVELLRDQNPGSKRHPPLGVPAGGHREAGEVGAEWGARRRGTCAPLCSVQRATDLSDCLSLASRFPPLPQLWCPMGHCKHRLCLEIRLDVCSVPEDVTLLCAPTLCFPPPPESKGGGRAIGLLLPPVELSGWGETEVFMEVSSRRLAIVAALPSSCTWPAFFDQSA